MSSKNDLDFFESLFDIDGDGKITPEDDYLFYMMTKECLGDDDDDSSHSPSGRKTKSRTAEASPTQAREQTPAKEQTPEEEQTPRQKYLAARANYELDLMSRIFTLIVFAVPVVLINWCVISCFEKGNDFSSMMVLFTLSAGVFVLVRLFMQMIPALTESHRGADEAKKEYEREQKQRRQ